MAELLRTAAAVEREPILGVDRAGFSRQFDRGPLAVRHTLSDHPLLTLDRIAELADSLPIRFVERHRGDLPKLMPGGAPDISGRPSDTVRGISENGCWMVLWYIEQNPAYDELLNQILDGVVPAVSDHGGMCHREAFLFLSAPNAVTPVHFDPEHNFLLQIRGVKWMNVCRFENRQTELRELERYYRGGHRNLESMPPEDESFELSPGVGVYVPSFMPHWVQNGPEASVSLSITFRTRRSQRAERVHALNARLGRLGVEARPPGVSPATDRVKELAYVGLLDWRSRLGVARRSLNRHRRSRR